MIAASLTLTSPVARNPITLRTIKTCPEAVAAWANLNLAGFAKSLGVSPPGLRLGPQADAGRGQGEVELMNNAPIGGRRPATEQPVGSGIWKTIRRAYDEIVAGAPMSYDIEGVPGLVGGRQRNYETAREACLTLKLAGQLPAWPRNQRVPLAIETTNRTLRLERRLGREANLVLTLTPPPAGVGAEFASVY